MIASLSLASREGHLELTLLDLLEVGVFLCVFGFGSDGVSLLEESGDEDDELEDLALRFWCFFLSCLSFGVLDLDFVLRFGGVDDDEEEDESLSDSSHGIPSSFVILPSLLKFFLIVSILSPRSVGCS